MGRWGMCLFQGDNDLVIRHEIASLMGLIKEVGDDHNIDQKLRSTELRDELNAGFCDTLFKICRITVEMKFPADYSMGIVILAAMVMQTGAKISDENMQHLRELVPRICSYPGYAPPFADDGFRDPGKKQFLAALEYYKPGTPRTFCEPSCYHCGKVKSDLGKELHFCARCKLASYCSKDCHKAHWKAHKPSCFDHKNPPMRLNV